MLSTRNVPLFMQIFYFSAFYKNFKIYTIRFYFYFYFETAEESYSYQILSLWELLFFNELQDYFNDKLLLSRRKNQFSAMLLNVVELKRNIKVNIFLFWNYCDDLSFTYCSNKLLLIGNLLIFERSNSLKQNRIFSNHWRNPHIY